MDRNHPLKAGLVPIGIAACLAAAGCGGDTAGQQTVRPASDQRPAAEATQRAGDARQSAREAPDAASDNSDGGSSNQSSSINQSSGGDSGDNQSNSIVQRSDSGSTSSSQSSSANGDVQTLSGAGETTISFGVDQPSRFSWTNSQGKPFSARGDGVSIDSRAGHGEADLAPGRYDNVRVRGSSWTIVIRPR